MDYRENPEENRKENGKEGQDEERQNEQFSFMQETIKNENGGYRKIRNTVLKCAGQGLLFGLAACIGFCALKPWAEEQFAGNPKKITIPEEEEENRQETEEEQSQGDSSAVTVDDYDEMNQALAQIGSTAGRSMVEISVRTAETDDETGDAGSSVAGVIFEDNGSQLLAAGKKLSVPEGGTLEARLADGSSCSIRIKEQDSNLNIAVYAIDKDSVRESAWSQIQTAVLGSSASMRKGQTVIAVGSPFGYFGGMGTGIVSAGRVEADKADGDYSLLCTDIGGSSCGTGVLVNTEGEIVGLIDQELCYEDGQPGPLAGYGISDIKKELEFLSNGQPVPYVGIYGVAVTEELTASQGIPSGVYVREVSPDSPAMAAGIQSGDVINKVGSTTVSSMSGFRNILMSMEAGDKVQIRGQRQGTGGYVDIHFNVTVGSRG